MTDKLHVGWSGFQGAPGHSYFYHDGTVPSQTWANEIRTFLAAATTIGGTLPDALPMDVKLTFDSFVTQFDPATGDQINLIGITPPASIIGTGGQNWAAPAGMCITWKSAEFLKGRRIVGRTFLVPLAQQAFGTDGSLNDAYRTAVASAAQAYIAATSVPVIWHRPPKGGPGNDGSNHPIVSASVADKVAILTSRRD